MQRQRKAVSAELPVQSEARAASGVNRNTTWEPEDACGWLSTAVTRTPRREGHRRVGSAPGNAHGRDERGPKELVSTRPCLRSQPRGARPVGVAAGSPFALAGKPTLTLAGSTGPGERGRGGEKRDGEGSLCLRRACCLACRRREDRRAVITAVRRAGRAQGEDGGSKQGRAFIRVPTPPWEKPLLTGLATQAPACQKAQACHAAENWLRMDPNPQHDTKLRISR